MLIPSLKDIPVPTTVPKGEYTLKIISTKDVTSNKEGNRPGIQFYCKILGVENTLPVFHTLWMGHSLIDDKEKYEGMMLRVKRFINAIGLDSDQELSNEDFNGVEFSAFLKETYFNGEPKNEIDRVL